MVRVGGGEVKSKAKGKEEHDEAEQEQLGRMILTIMIIDIMMKCSRKKWSFMALLATHFLPPFFSSAIESSIYETDFTFKYLVSVKNITFNSSEGSIPKKN